MKYSFYLVAALGLCACDDQTSALQERAERRHNAPAPNADRNADRNVDEGAGGSDGSGGSGGSDDANNGGSGGQPDRPNPGSGSGARDADGDGHLAGPADCDDHNNMVFDGAPERCDGLDNDCDGEIDEGCHDPNDDHNAQDDDGAGGSASDDDHAQDNDGVTPREHILIIEVGRDSQQSAIQFAWGYCSDVQRAEQCDDAWHDGLDPNASRVLWDTAVRQTILVLETGWVRFNASFYNDGDDVQGGRIVGRPNGWFCELTENADGLVGASTTATLKVWLDGHRVSDRDIADAMDPVLLDGGCSGALDIELLVDRVL